MSITKQVSQDGNHLTIFIEGRFDFASHQPFRQAYESERATEYCIDLANTTYLDSSALGMLLLLRDHAGGEQASISIRNCSEEVMNIFTISNFDQLFDIQ